MDLEDHRNDPDEKKGNVDAGYEQDKLDRVEKNALAATSKPVMQRLSAVSIFGAPSKLVSATRL